MFYIQTNKYLYKHIYLHVNQSDNYELEKEAIDMRKGLMIGACVMVVGLLLMASIPTDFRTSAGPAVPHNTWGDAYESDGITPLADGETITSWVDGVMYGTNVTFGSTYDIDTMGNNTLDETPEVKEGGWFGEDIMYIWGDGTLTTDRIFQESAIWDQGNSENFDLNEADTTAAPFNTFEWLKISNLTVDSGIIPGGVDFIIVHNPGGTAMNLFNYSIQKNEQLPVSASPTWPITAVALEPNPTLNTIAAGGWAWVNLSALGIVMNPAGDELKLVWNNEPGPNAPFGGMPVVVDRLEYGNQTWEPDNTTMPDAVAPANTIRRTSFGADTNDCWMDFMQDIEFAWDPTDVPAQVVITATDANPHIVLDWTAVPGAYGYKVYAYNDSTFAGFTLDKGNPTTVLVGMAIDTWQHDNGYTDADSWGYIVRSYAAGGENTNDGNNIGFNLKVSLNVGDNMLALQQISILLQLLNDGIKVQACGILRMLLSRREKHIGFLDSVA
jgi:hypothetical protein